MNYLGAGQRGVPTLFIAIPTPQYTACSHLPALANLGFGDSYLCSISTCHTTSVANPLLWDKLGAQRLGSVLDSYTAPESQHVVLAQDLGMYFCLSTLTHRKFAAGLGTLPVSPVLCRLAGCPDHDLHNLST